MGYINKIVGIFLDTLFPRGKLVSELEKMSPEEIMATLPSAKFIGRHTIHALFSYKNHHAKTLVWEIKYKKNRILAEKIGLIFAKKILENPKMVKPVVIVPIPISKKREKNRGYNQSELICKEIIKNSKDLFFYREDLIIKTKETPKQAFISNRKLRFRNMAGSFGISKTAIENNFIAGKNFIIIDDVVTTGATILEAAKMLMNAGARSVFCFAIAH